MTTVSRPFKALAVSSLGVAASHLILSDTLYLGFAGQASATLGGGPAYSADQAFTTALVNTALVMPLVLWIGLRISGERRLWLTVTTGTFAWICAVWNGVDHLDDAPGALLPLRSMLLVAAVTAVASLIPTSALRRATRRRSAPPPPPAPGA
ncbi:hypothetical protein [Streptomyces sp. NBC_01268]|uniref:hypothetical protein n=1 Tax=Streptomyces sp. NBC_01268 TaxID=2903806 RepID=UPI002E36E35F|nr:hypothetical protein [Streptomyces sp. NBC_01268]